jgi:hypothetical protein
MSDYLEGQNLDILDVATPIDGASAYECALAIRQIKSVLKAVIQHSHKPNGALKGGTITSLSASVVGSSQLQDGAVTAIKLATNSVETAKIKALAVTTEKLADGSITTVKYGAASIPTAAFKPNSIPLSCLQATFGTAQLADNCIIARHLSLACIDDTKVASVGIGKLSGGADGQFLFRVGGTWQAVSADGSLVYDTATGKFSINSGLAAAYFGDVKALGTPGGAGTTGTWTQRVIAEMADMDQADITTFNSNYVILDTGVYFFHARCPASGVGNHKARLMKKKVSDGSDPTVIAIGSNAVSDADNQTDSVVECYIVVTDTLWKYYLEHWIETSVGTSDYGVAASVTDTTETYTQGYLIKVS